MVDTARVCVIGGGVMGVGVLYHLALEGWTDSVLVEKGELTSGSTWHAAGQVPNFIASLNMGKIHEYGVQLYPKLQEETGSPVSWHGCGGVRLAITDDDVDWFKYVYGVSKLIGYESYLVSPDEIKELHPYLDLFGVKLGFHTVRDGHVDPSSITQAMALGSRNRGARIRRHTRVIGISRRQSGEWLVETNEGDDIVCEHVVNAAGSYGRRVCQFVGLDAPITNVMHQYVVTESVSEIASLDYELPVVRDPYTHGYLRQEQSGILVGPYEDSGARGCFMDNDSVPPWSFDMELLEPELDRLLPWLERASERFPLFGKYGIKNVISGPITHTPDGNFLLGPAPSLELGSYLESVHNFWMACGASIGICQGGGAGKYLAQWIVHGESEINMAEFDPRRFGGWAVGDYCDKKAIDDYQHMYHLHMPGEYRDVARGVRVSPLYDRHKERGADFQQVFGWERPKCFSGGESEVYSFRRSNFYRHVEAECLAVRDSVGVLDLSSFAKFWVHGRDSVSFMDRIVANILPRVGRIGLGHFLNEHGIIEGEASIVNWGDDFVVYCGTSAEMHDGDIMRKSVLFGEDVTIENVTDGGGALLVTGPKSRSLLSGIFSESLASSDFPWLSARRLKFDGEPVNALRVSYAGELGWELHCARDSLGLLYDAIMSEGESYGVRDIGYSALNHLRMEKAYRSMGAELTNELTLLEADMSRFIGFSKGDFIGKSALLERRTSGCAVRLVYLEVDSADSDCFGNEPVYHKGVLVGVTTSGAYGFSVGKSLAFAYVPVALAVLGESFEIMMFGDMRSAKVLPEAAWDPKNERLRA